jgi:hypothetical protein
VASVLQPHKTESRWQQRSNAIADRANNITMTLRIERSVRQGMIVFTLSGHMKADEVAELKALFDTDYKTIVLDLHDVRLADRDAVKFLSSCETSGIKLENCPAYVREWMERERIEGASS